MFKFRFAEGAADIDEGMGNHWRFFVMQLETTTLWLFLSSDS